MGFDLTGYEKDDSYTMSSFFIYTSFSIVLLIIITLLLGFYFFIESEKTYDLQVLQDEVVSAIEYKNKQKDELNSFDQFLDGDIIITRIPINKAIEKTVDFYNE
tara:strand:+ start:1920 stop:2231 length:312 start_codon:yes stop_codon:yes gene_type:complete